ncbi:MAG: hypothetical protein HYV26_08380 [Candidatus Hydrogenedentes bacterium]|nr:hypothetical protein [Candidatus Hydrogenedentota bacterium]
MKASRTTKCVLTLAFLAIVFVEGAVQTALELGHGDAPHVLQLFTRVPNAANLRAFETRLEKGSWSIRWTRPATQYARYLLMRDLGAKAIQGTGDWLFYRPAVDFAVQPWPDTKSNVNTADEALAAIVDFRNALAARGIALLVVIAPNKSSIYPDELSARARGNEAAVHAHSGAFMERLGQAGVPLVDLFALFTAARAGGNDPGCYLAHDTHWSPAGMRLAAQAVAERVLAEDWASAGARQYEERAVAAPREGDLLRMVDAPRIARHFAPRMVAYAQVIDVTTAAPYDDDPASPILVLGDSFLRIYQQDEPGAAGFVSHLARNLRQPVASIVNDGGASTLVRQELARRPELLQGKRLVIWEFVERDLRFGTEGWQHVALPEVSPTPS